MVELTEEQRQRLLQARPSAPSTGGGLTDEQRQRLLTVRPQGFPPEPTGGVSVNQQAADEFNARLQAGGRALTDGALFGFSDQFAGSLLGGGGLLGFNRDQDPAQARRDQLAQDREQFPGVVGAGNLMGGAATSMAALPAAVGRTTVGTLGRMMGIGAGEGALQGYGYGRTADDAAWGAGVGALGGLAAGGLTRAMQAGGDAARGGVASAVGRPVLGRAGRAVGQTMERANMSFDDVDAWLQSARADGQDVGVVADALGRPGQRTLSGVARQPGDGAAEIADALRNRQAGQGNRLGQYVSEALDANETAAQRTARLTAARDTEADQLYSAARGNAAPVDVRGVLRVIDDEIGPAANNAGVPDDLIGQRFAYYRNRLAGQDPDGNSVELSDFNRVLRLRRELRDEIDSARQGGNRQRAAELAKIYRAMDGALEDASIGYRQANDTFAQRSRDIEATPAGETAARPMRRAEDVVAEYSALPPDGQASYRTGYADRRLGQIENDPPGTNSARRFSSDRERQLFEQMSRDPALWQRRLDRELTMFETGNQALGGSRTADNLADNADVNNLGPLASLVQGDAVGAAGGASRQIAAAAMGMNEETRNLIARALMSNDTQMLDRLMQSSRVSGQQRKAAEAFLRNYFNQNRDAAERFFAPQPY